MLSQKIAKMLGFKLIQPDVVKVEVVKVTAKKKASKK